jgi:hypothetical protein
MTSYCGRMNHSTRSYCCYGTTSHYCGTTNCRCYCYYRYDRRMSHGHSHSTMTTSLRDMLAVASDHSMGDSCCYLLYQQA